jgi:integrase
MTVLSLLKKNRIKTEFSLGTDLPEFEEEPAIPYEPAELKKLFEGMDAEETIRYKFFLGTACREQEVMYAAWQDIDFARGLYHVRRKPEIDSPPRSTKAET